MKTGSLGGDSSKLPCLGSVLPEPNQREEAWWKDIVEGFGVCMSAQHTDILQVVAFLSLCPYLQYWAPGAHTTYWLFVSLNKQ